jgi:hypothetical protein
MSRILSAALLLVTTMTLYAGNPRIPAGIDTWQTIGGGATQMSFADEPIPADFFCEGASAFTGTIHFEGVPLATEPPGLFGRTDTIVARLDETTIENGRGFSRLQIKAMHLVSRNTIQTDCGLFTVNVGLAENQPITTIDYLMKSKSHGVFNADLVLTARMSFVNTEDPSDVRVLDRTVHFTEFIHTPFYLTEPAADKPEIVRGKRTSNRAGESFEVDSDADGQPDTVLSLNQGLIYVDGYYCETEDQFAQPYLDPAFDEDCVEEVVTHQSPTDAHTTTPTCIICPNDEIDDFELPNKNSGRAGQRTVDGKLSDTSRHALLQRMRELEADGRLIIPAEQLIEELMAKGRR